MTTIKLTTNGSTSVIKAAAWAFLIHSLVLLLIYIAMRVYRGSGNADTNPAAVAGIIIFYMMDYPAGIGWTAISDKVSDVRLAWTWFFVLGGLWWVGIAAIIQYVRVFFGAWRRERVKSKVPPTSVIE